MDSLAMERGNGDLGQVTALAPTAQTKVAQWQRPVGGMASHSSLFSFCNIITISPCSPPTKNKGFSYRELDNSPRITAQPSPSNTLDCAPQ